MKKGFKAFVALAALALLLPGSLVFAKENGNNRGGERNKTERTERKENRDRDNRGDKDKGSNESNETVSVDMTEAVE